MSLFSKTKKTKQSKFFSGRDIISLYDFSKDDIIKVLETAKKMEIMPLQKKTRLLQGIIVATLFFEPSTRTRLSFESAALQLGARIIGFSDPQNTSKSKGESLHDTIKMVENYADIIIMRHPQEGAARAAADATEKIIINAGDGANQHPTQTFLDLYTIKKSQGTISKLKIAMVGDLKYGRTVHSLTTALAHFDVELYFISPVELKMPAAICYELKQKKIIYKEHQEINEVINEVDILYMTRIQKERFPDPIEYQRVKDKYVLKKEHLKKVKTNLKILHPLPRINEINNDIDDTIHAHYFVQAKNSIPVRQALLALVTGAVR